MSSFYVGVSVRDITPEPGVPMWGYSGRSGPATGTLDPLFAKALVFRCGEETAALVALDLGRVPLEDSCNRIRVRARQAGINHVMFAATHTHHGPVMEMEDAPHTMRIEQIIGDALEDAVSKAQPARIGVGRTEFDIAHNRRKLLPNGRCAMVWRNEKRLPTSPLDPEATIVKIETMDREPLAILVHYACHPVIMGPSNIQYSADYVGELTRLVKESAGGECIFLQGGCGDINPYLDKTPIDAGGVEAMRTEGRACAEAVLRRLNDVEATVPEHPAVAFSETSVHVGTRWDFSDPEQADTWGASHPSLFQAYRHRITPDLALPLAVLALNGELAFAGIPGEPFIDYQLELKSRAPVAHALLLGYCNDFHAYIPTVCHAAAGGYGGTVGSYVGLGAGDKLLTQACIDIGRLAGTIRPRCTADDFIVLDANNEIPKK